MDGEEIDTALLLVGLAESREVLIPEQVELLAACVREMAKALRVPAPQTATLDDAARYLRALWPKGSSLTFFAGDEIAQPHVRWSSHDWSGEVVYVVSVKSEAPSSALSRIVEQLRAMAEEECNVATDRAARLRAAIGGET